MANKWIPISEVSELRSGDVFACPTKVPKSSPILAGLVVPIISHVGMIVIIDGETKVIHNPFDGSPEIVPYESIFTDRKIGRIIRTNITTEEILSRFRECEDQYKCNIRDEYAKEYKFFYRNCEDFVRSLCNCNIGFDQRRGWGIGIGIGLIIILLLLTRKN